MTEGCSLFIVGRITIRTRGHLPNKTKQADVNEPGFVLTEFPRAQAFHEHLYRRVCHN